MTDPETFQLQIQDLIAHNRIHDAVDLAIKEVGGEVYGYLARLAKDEDIAMDAFQAFSLDLWRGLPKFGWRSAFKTWAYTLARRALYRQYDSAYQRRGQRLHTEEELRLQDRCSRTATSVWQQTRTRHWMWDLIAAFPPEDQELLTLRLVNDLGWIEIVEVMASEEPQSLDEAEVKKRAAALRKRFQRLKDRIKEAREARQAAEEE